MPPFRWVPFTTINLFTFFSHLCMCACVCVCVKCIFAVLYFHFPSHKSWKVYLPITHIRFFPLVAKKFSAEDEKKTATTTESTIRTYNRNVQINFSHHKTRNGWTATITRTKVNKSEVSLMMIVMCLWCVLKSQFNIGIRPIVVKSARWESDKDEDNQCVCAYIWNICKQKWIFPFNSMYITTWFSLCILLQRCLCLSVCVAGARALLCSLPLSPDTFPHMNWNLLRNKDIR